MAKQGGTQKAGRAKRTPSNATYKASNRLAINRAKRAKKDAKGKVPKILATPHGLARQKRRQERMTTRDCPKHGRSFQLSGVTKCLLCVEAFKHNVRARAHNELFARRAEHRQEGIAATAGP